MAFTYSIYLIGPHVKKIYVESEKVRNLLHNIFYFPNPEENETYNTGQPISSADLRKSIEALEKALYEEPYIRKRSYNTEIKKTIKLLKKVIDDIGLDDDLVIIYY